MIYYHPVIISHSTVNLFMSVWRRCFGPLHYYYPHFLQWVEARHLWRSCEDVFWQEATDGQSTDRCWWGCAADIFAPEVPYRICGSMWGEIHTQQHVTHTHIYININIYSAHICPVLLLLPRLWTNQMRPYYTSNQTLGGHSGFLQHICCSCCAERTVETTNASAAHLTEEESQLLHVPTVQIAKRSNKWARVGDWGESSLWK